MPSGPLEGVTVVELAGIGPAPHCCMMLSDMGATVIRCEPPGGRSGLSNHPSNVLSRGRKSIIVDLKRPEGRDIILRLCETADAFIEGFRPGVTEKLGVGPDECMARNPKLVYARMTGFGQAGPYASSAGHDINYIALTGALHAIGPKDSKPSPPLNLVGDFGGGGMLMAFGIVSGLLQAKTTGKGNVIDGAMVDGASALLAPLYGMMAAGQWKEEARGSNMLDGGAHFYDTYECKDGKYVSIGSIEPQFYALLLKLSGLESDPSMDPSKQMKRDNWGAAKAALEAAMKTKTRDEWCAIMEYTDICFAPVLTMREAFEHPHAKARGSYIDIGGVVQPAPAPRFSNTPAGVPAAPPVVGGDTVGVLKAVGMSDADIQKAIAAGVVVDRSRAAAKL